MTTFITKAIIGIAAITGLLTATPAFATTGTGTANLSATPNSGSFDNGTTFTVTIRETSSGPVAGVQSDLHYDQAKLQCLGVDATGSAFVQQYQNSCGNGLVSIARTTQGTTVTGSQKIASITFKALAGSGTTKLTFAGSSEILDDAVNNVCNSTCAEGAQAASFTLTTPAPAQPASPAPSSPATTSTPTNNDKAKTAAVLSKDTTQPEANTPAPQTAPANSEQTQLPNNAATPADVVKSNGGFPFLTVLGLLGVTALVGATIYVNRRVAAAAVPVAAKKAAPKKKAATAATKKTTKAKKPAARRKPAVKK